LKRRLRRKAKCLRKVRELHEVNPMLGHRGVRLGLTFPEIYRMQIQAILEATAECQLANIDVRPEIMVPQVCTAEELEQVKVFVDEIKAKLEARTRLNSI
jgi:pyruvate,orthophosphate dikinase